MPPYNKNDELEGEQNTKITTHDLRSMLELNKRAVEIYVEVENQNEDIKKELEIIREKVEEIDKALFKLTIVFGTMGIGTIATLIKLLVGH